MSGRIRSVHPGQWTDGEFVSCSPVARLLALALRNEADDNGVFVWSPVDLKIRLLPMDAVDVEELLQELVDKNQVRCFQSGGKTYGVIRNFRKWQRPKRPTSRYPFPNEVRSYAGCSEQEIDKGGGDPEQEGAQEKEIPPHVPNTSGKSSAEVGGRRKEVGGKVLSKEPNGAHAPSPRDGPDLTKPDVQLYHRGREVLGKKAGGVITKLLKAKGDSIPEARAAIETAATKADPSAYIGAIIAGSDPPDDSPKTLEDLLTPEQLERRRERERLK